MATRSRRSAASAAVEEEEEQEGVKKLKFKQSLVSRPGKQIGLSELLSRLKTLCDELRDISQEEADTESLTPAAKELAHHSLIQHKDAGVRAWTACCLVDMFRLFAPNAPYPGSQLKVWTQEGTTVVHCRANSQLGNIYPDRRQDPPSSSRPLTPLQQSAFVHTEIASRIQEYCHRHRYSRFRQPDQLAIYNMFRRTRGAFEGLKWRRIKQECRASYDGSPLDFN